MSLGYFAIKPFNDVKGWAREVYNTLNRGWCPGIYESILSGVE